MRVNRTLTWLVWIAGGAYIALFLFTASLRLVYPYEVEWNEGAVLDHAVRVLAGHAIYAAPSLDFSAFVYTPLYYYVVALAMKIGGVGLGAGRLISIFSTLATALFAARIVFRESGSQLLSFAAASFYIAFYHLTGFFYDIVRMDAFALFLAAASLYAALYHRRGYLTAALWISLAYFTKQQMLFMLPVIVIGLAVRDKKHAMAFLAISAALMIGATILFNQMTGGWYEYFTMAIPSVKARNEFSLQTALEFFPKWFFSAMGCFSFIILCGILIRPRKQFDSATVMLLAGFVMAVLSSAISIGNSGGYQNVFMPLALMMAIMFPLTIQWIASSFPKQKVIVPTALLLGFFSLVFNPLGQTMLLASARQKHGGDECLAAIKTIPGDAWIPFHGYIGTLVGKHSHIHFMAMNDVLLMHDAASGHLRREIDSSLAAHRFGAIVLDENRVFHWDSIAHYARSGPILATPNLFLSRIGDAPTRPNILYLPAP